jgi:hypothetical protein
MALAGFLGELIQGLALAEDIAAAADLLKIVGEQTVDQLRRGTAFR